MRAALALSFVFVMLFPQISQAETADTYADLARIPGPLLDRLMGGGNGQFRENYITQVLQPLRQHAPNKTSITAASLAEIKQNYELDHNRMAALQRITGFMRFDLNSDGKVDAAEIAKASAQEQGVRRRGAQANNLLELYDTDNDGTATLNEALSSPSAPGISNFNRPNESKRLEELLKLDPNDDGTLTAEELEMLAIKAFRTVDKDNNGILTKEEQDPLHELIQKRRQQQEHIRQMEQLGCDNIPKPAADEVVIYLGAYEGVALSSATVGGQSVKTSLIPVNLANTAGKLYIIAATYTANIWQFTGNTNSISRIVLASRPEAGTLPPTGAIGINADRISYMNANCLGENAFSATTRGSFEGREELSNGIKLLIDREPNHLFNEKKFGAVTISGNENYELNEVDHIENLAAPAGFDTALWKEATTKFYPMGIITVDPTKVVSRNKVEAYEVFPSWIGLAKLLHEGSILADASSLPRDTAVIDDGEGIEGLVIQGFSRNQIRIEGGATLTSIRSDGYRIVKAIPYYPSGLTGEQLVSFTIAKGLPVPKGSAGHSCVTDENTGESNGTACAN